MVSIRIFKGKIDNNIVTFVGYPAEEVISLERATGCRIEAR
jgi:hypothetical protein